MLHLKPLTLYTDQTINYNSYMKTNNCPIKTKKANKARREWQLLQEQADNEKGTTLNIQKAKKEVISHLKVTA